MTGDAAAPAPDGLAIPPDLLDVDPETMRRLGYAVVDRVVEHLAGLRDVPAISVADPATLDAALGGPLPRGAAPVEDGLRLLADVAARTQQHGDHPRYFARVPGPSSYVGILGEWLATGTQTIASSWGGGAGPTTVELVACDWLREALGLAPGWEGVLLSGGSMANVNGLVAARVAVGPGVIYLSDQTHSSLRRGLLAMGQPPEQIRVLPTGDDLRLTAAAVRDAIAADRAAGLAPAIVIGTAGTTNTGTVDELDALADVCAEHGLWFHVDGAYGGPVALTPRGRAALAGLDRADSVVVDPHKWLFQPYDIAALLVRRPGALERAFAMHPEYLKDVQGDDVSLHNRSLELTHRGRGFKLWLTFRTYGADALADAIERGVALAEHAQRVIERDPALAVATPAQLGVVTFTAPGASAAAHGAAAAALTADGYAALTTTVLHGRTVLRLCTINPRTSADDIEGTLARLSALLAG